MKSTDSVIVSWDFSHGKDAGVLIVGRQQKGRVEIINAYQGEEAKEIYQKLVFHKSKKINYSEEQPKKLTREQKECLSAHYLNCKDWMLVEETEFYYRIINKNTGVIKSVDKFRRVRRRKNHENN